MRETKAEIVVVAGVAAALLWLWWANRASGAGSGLDGFPALAGAGSGGQLTAPVLNSIPAAAGLSVNPGDYSGTATGLPTCNCGDGSGAGLTFGSSQDMAAWIATNGGSQLQQDIAALTAGNWS